MGGSRSRAQELAPLRTEIVEAMGAANEARERGLTSCRRTIRSSSRSIRMVHRRESDDAVAVAAEAEGSLRDAQGALRPHPQLVYAGFLHDAEKEFAEARLFAALATRAALPDHLTLQVEPSAWLNGLAEAASELRRFVLDELKRGRVESGDELLEDMDDVYELLVSVDFPDALTGGLRRTTDAFRAVLERTRSDYTTTVLQERLRQAIESKG